MECDNLAVAIRDLKVPEDFLSKEERHQEQQNRDPFESEWPDNSQTEENDFGKRDEP